MHLHKLHATGNDFLVYSLLDGAPPPSAVLAAALCDRHTGVGADGLLLLGPGYDGADCTMTLHNADGGLAEMSGNGSRCLAWAAARAGLGTDTELVVDTGGGRRTIRLERDATGEVVAAETDMGPVTFDPAEIPLAADSPFGLEATFHGTLYEGDAAGVGNPHWVLFVEDPATARVTQHGPHLEVDERFPKRTNVEFVRVDDRTHLTMRVWERGVGETQSCGTGACASVAVAHRRGLVEPTVDVAVLGGTLRVTVGATVTLAGPVVHVFDVDVDPDRLG
ncbi:MAG TPA: diaminopimelate epimerase [Acidimicrobiia bacterium]|nr:diaminopimelate epimerase [Acidimicrobiia bacterium]